MSNYKHVKFLKKLENFALNGTKRGFILMKLKKFYKKGYLDGFRKGRSNEWSDDAVKPGHPKNTYPGFNIYNEDKEDE